MVRLAKASLLVTKGDCALGHESPLETAKVPVVETPKIFVYNPLDLL